jgi:hypothetical protein
LRPLRIFFPFFAVNGFGRKAFNRKERKENLFLASEAIADCRSRARRLVPGFQSTI